MSAASATSAVTAATAGVSETQEPAVVEDINSAVQPPEWPDLDAVFAEFYADLTVEHDARRALDAQLVQGLAKYIAVIDSQLESEIKARKETDAILDKLAASRLDTAQRQLLDSIQQGLTALHRELDETMLQLGRTEEQLVDARRETEEAMSNVQSEMARRLDEVEAAIRYESKARRDEDESIEKEYPFIISELQVLLEKESIEREDVVRLLKGRLSVMEHDEIKAGERAQLKLFAMLRQLRRELQLEKEARVTEEQKATGTLEEYGVALQQGLIIVNKNDYK